MSVDADWLRDLFEPFGPVTIRRMFSGAGVYRDGVCFALALGGGLYLKCDAEIEPRFRAAGSSPFTYGRQTRKVALSYWSVPEPALDDGDELKAWAELSFAAALRAAEAKKKPKRAKRQSRTTKP